MRKLSEVPKCQVPLPKDSAIKNHSKVTSIMETSHSFRVAVDCFKGFVQFLRNTFSSLVVYRNKSSSGENILSFITYLKSNFTLPLKSSVICLDFITVSASEVHAFFCHFFSPTHSHCSHHRGKWMWSTCSHTLCATNTSSDLGNLAFDGIHQSLD